MARSQLVAALLCVLLCCSLLCSLVLGQQTAPTGRLTFIPRTANASWSARWDSNIEFHNKPLRFNTVNGTEVYWPGRVFILQGNGDGSAAQRSNDVWASGDLGLTWHLIAGRTAAGVSAWGTRASSSFTPLSRPATGMDHMGRIWRVGGRTVNGVFSTQAWMSTNGGLTWTNQASLQGASPFAPGRERAGLMFDSRDNVYLLGGMINTANTMVNDVWRSSNLGVVWTRQAEATPWVGRGSGLFFNFVANEHAQIDFTNNPSREILIFTTGWSGAEGAGSVTNELWISSDYSTSWSRVRSNWGLGYAPFRARDAANGEVTKGGVLIIVGGQADDAQGSEILNDVWVSLDGGYSWGLCVEDATFNDRRDLLTVLDDEGYLYVGGGANWVAPYTTFNDFWRSSFSFDNITAVTEACGVRVPACGTGLTCWPGDPRTTFYSNGTVTCPASRACAGQDAEAYLDFQPQTLTAPWSKRWAPNLESFPRAFQYRDMNGIMRSAASGSLILSGGQNQNNDVWLSQDKGVSWQLIAGYASYTPEVKAGGQSARTSFFPALSESTGIVDARYGAIYRLGGYGAGGESNDVWRTSNGYEWTKQAATNLPPRSGANVVVDDRGTIFVVGGVVNNVPLNDIWYSDDNATTFNRRTALQAPFFQPRRAKGFLLHRYSWQLQRDILFFGSGWDGSNSYNDIWVSSDSAATWTLVCAAAPFEPRDAAFAEITAQGLIVMGGGQTGAYTQNDVWVSPDGGFTWASCGTEQYWPDRRDAGAVFDGDEYLYIVGGREGTNANSPLFNDVYRSTFPLNDLARVAQACSINIPWCGAGLSCWPGAQGTQVYDGGVSCQWTRWCEGNASYPRPSSTAAPRRSSSSSTGRAGRPFNPCRDLYPIPPECDNYEGESTGMNGGAAGGLTNWAIGGIVVLVVGVVGGLLFFFYRRARAAKQSAEGHTNGQQLLGNTYETSTA